MPRQKAENTKRREKMLKAFNSLDAVGQQYIILYTEKLAELHELEDVTVKKVKEYRESNELRCSFCDKTKDEVQRLIVRGHIFICNECVQLCTEILEECNDADDSDCTTEE